MRNFERVKCGLALLCAISAALVSCDDFDQQNNTKTVGLDDPGIDATVKAALENGSVSEVVVRKDLLLFPVNAPNLVIAHSQEIHAVPQQNSSNATDGKPVAAEVAEVNEYSLSQLVNNTDNDTTSQGIAIPVSSFPNGSENDSVLEPGKLLEIVSGFNLSNGVATEKVPLPSEVQDFSLPKHSIVELLSKSLPQADDAAPMIGSSSEAPSYYVGKRSVDDDDDDDEDDDSQSNGSESTEDDDDSQSDDADLEKRSAESDEKDDSSDSKSDESSATKSGSNSSTTTETVKKSTDSGDDADSSSTTENGSSSTTESATSTGIAKRSIDSDEDDSSSTTENDSSSTTESATSTGIAKRSIDSDEDDSKSDSSEESTQKTSTSTSRKETKRSAEEDHDDDGDDSSASNSTEYYDHVVSKSSKTADSQAESSSVQRSGKESLVRDSEDDMDVAEDMVFRPLFRYRQETLLRQRYPFYGRSRNYGNRYRYRADDSDYD
ncbi:hypothetical protein TSAR_005989 [Trichomalopsis sarcophagae]|uniref:Uncharacterized protein n=1 Tax=Trichomalopsis sarcophagae TaxID=543379 RepID=A0A232F9N8_9HYME|nr:hypothetical protein TSAR_005989 [Trichomalopsis sarcophagae]